MHVNASKISYLGQLLTSDKVFLLAPKAIFESIVLTEGISKSFVMAEMTWYFCSFFRQKSCKSNCLASSGSMLLSVC